jgi:hypothetical protein
MPLSRSLLVRSRGPLQSVCQPTKISILYICAPLYSVQVITLRQVTVGSTSYVYKQEERGTRLIDLESQPNISVIRLLIEPLTVDDPSDLRYNPVKNRMPLPERSSIFSDVSHSICSTLLVRNFRHPSRTKPLMILFTSCHRRRLDYRSISKTKR